jgi:hypothetical protein
MIPSRRWIYRCAAVIVLASIELLSTNDLLLVKGHIFAFIKESAAHNLNNFSAVVDQLTPEEMLVARRIISN